MGLESTTTIAGLVSTNPVASDAVGQADDHLRLIKNVLKTIFPGAGGVGFSIPITATEAELNYVDGVTSAIQTQLNTISAAAATADGKAVTADGKAVAAQADATTALANAATADGKAVTADGKAVTAQNTANALIPLASRLWAFFGNNTGTYSITEGSGVANITKISTGIYKVNFSVAQANANYAVFASADLLCTISLMSTTDFRVNCYNVSGTLTDASNVSVMILSTT